MMFPKHVKDKLAGESLGLQYKYRLTQIHGRYVLYNVIDGNIVEKIQKQESDIFTKEKAMQRLFEINGLENIVDAELCNEIDEIT
jgi:hypothetical protein